MNGRLVLQQLGRLMLVLSSIMLAMGGLSALPWMGGEGLEIAALAAMAISAVLGLVIGMVLLTLAGPTDDRVGRREAMALVATSWMLGAVLAAAPYAIWVRLDVARGVDHPFRSLVNCFFESMSGLTTTGATILTDVDALPRALLLWRATTQWLGGLGIVVLFVAVLPSLGVAARKLFQYEASGPTHEGVRPRIRETARALWIIYVGMSVTLVGLLWFCGMSLFDAVCHAMTALSTGGFSTRNASMGAADFTLAAELVIVLFMFLGGVSFGLYYHLLRGHWRLVFRDAELRWYTAIVLGATLVLAITLMNSSIVSTDPASAPVDGSAGQALRFSLFQVVSIQTTTGFGTADFDQWPFLAKAVLVMLMFVGGSAGSTAGGIKVIRILIAAKVLIAELQRAFRPNVIRPIKAGRVTVDPELRQMVLVYVLGIILMFVLGAVAVAAIEAGMGRPTDFTTAATAVAATLNNIGPGLGEVGAVRHYEWLSAPSKLLLSLLMLIGRLEIYAVVVLFVPSFWRTDR